MGITRFSGPVYGGKSLLWTHGPYTQTGSSGASTVLFGGSGAQSIRVIPPYEDWFITEVTVTASTNSSVAAGHAIYLKTEGGSTTVPRPDGTSTRAATIVAITSPGGSTNWSTWATATASPGEYEGSWVPAGSTLRIVTSGVTLLGLTQVNVMGYIRYIDSTRSAG